MIPLVYAGFLTSAYQNPTTNVDRIHAAVVDEHTATDVTLAGGRAERLDLGRRLETSLTDPHGTSAGFTWEAMDADQADSAMENQRVRVVLTIPRGFSAAVTKVATSDATGAQRQTLQLRTDDGINYMAGTLASSIAARLEEQLTSTGTSQYISGILVSLQTVRSGMVEARDGASGLAEGARGLRSGLSDLSRGTHVAAQGAARLQSGARALAVATVSADEGAATLDSGAALLARGAHDLTGGVDAYTSGVHDAAGASATLAGGAQGLPALVAGVDSYTSGVDRLSRAVIDGDSSTPSLAEGAQRLAAGLGSPSDTGDPQDPSRNTTVVAGADALATGSAALSGALGSQQTTDRLAELGTGATDLAQGIQQYTQMVAQAQQLCSSGDTARCAALLTELTTRSQALVEGSGQVSQGVASVGQEVGSAQKAAGRIDSGAHALLAATRTAARGAKALQQGIGSATDRFDPSTGSGGTVSGVLNALTTQSQSLRDGAHRASALVAATQQMSTGLGLLDANGAALARGTAGLSEGVHRVSANSQELRDGAARAARGTTDLSTGAGTLTEGLDELARGAGQLSTSSAALTSGVTALAKGASTADAGSVALSAGAQRLARGLGQGSARIPALSGSDSSTIAAVVSHPVQVGVSRDHAMANNGGDSPRCSCRWHCGWGPSPSSSSFPPSTAVPGARRGGGSPQCARW